MLYEDDCLNIHNHYIFFLLNNNKKKICNNNTQYSVKFITWWFSYSSDPDLAIYLLNILGEF